MDAKLVVDIPSINWAYTYHLDPDQVQSAGRGKHNAVEIPDPKASDRHAEFYFTRGSWNVRDLGSDTGVFVNERLVQDTVLKHGDCLKLGNSIVVFECPEEAEEEEEWREASGILNQEKGQLDQGLARLESGDAGGAAAIRPLLLPRLKSENRSGVVKSTPEEDVDDLVWVARSLAHMIEDTLGRKGSREFMFQAMLMRLRTDIGADFGFLMTPDAKSGRWLIRTQVGNSFRWSGYERAHPVPLSVANAAFNRCKVVSNALEGDEEVEEVAPSASMLALNVNSYIAVPLLKGTKCRGVLYFDTRNPSKEFLPRHVRLLERAGDYIVEIEDHHKH